MAHYVLKPRMLVELSDTIRDILKKQGKVSKVLWIELGRFQKPECFRCSELVVQCRECGVCNARFHRYCVDDKCVKPDCLTDFNEEVINH